MRSDGHDKEQAKSSHRIPEPQDTSSPAMSYSQRFQMGLNATNAFRSSPAAANQATTAGLDNNSHLDKLYYQIADGYKILVLMRGLPGSGKSTVARHLIEKANLDPSQHILGADDYFTDRFGNYSYDRSRISEAHADCLQRAKAKMMNNFSPIIIDNTNIRLWEMEGHCVNAVDHGYIVHILEPTTSWAKNPDECFRRNSHNVPFDSILNMRKTYERIKNGQELLDTFHLPKRIQFQLRDHPPIVKTPEVPEEPQVIKSFSPIAPEMIHGDDIVIDSEEIVKLSPFENFNWTAHEKEVTLFWKENILSKEGKMMTIPKPQRAAATTTTAGDDKSLCDLMLSALKDDTEASGSGEEQKSEEPEQIDNSKVSRIDIWSSCASSLIIPISAANNEAPQRVSQ